MNQVYGGFSLQDDGSGIDMGTYDITGTIIQKQT